MHEYWLQATHAPFALLTCHLKLAGVEPASPGLGPGALTTKLQNHSQLQENGIVASNGFNVSLSSSKSIIR